MLTTQSVQPSEPTDNPGKAAIEKFLHHQRGLPLELCQAFTDSGYDDPDSLLGLNADDIKEILADFEAAYQMQMPYKLKLRTALRALSDETSSDAKQFESLYKMAEPQVSTPPPPQFDVMLSYNWDHQRHVAKIKESLTARGLSVWVDTERMDGHIYQRMAEALKVQRILIPFQHSTNCRRELKFAADEGKHIVPLRLDRRTPEPWACLITAGALYILIADFVEGTQIDEAAWEEKMEELVKNIRNPMESAFSSPAVTSNGALPSPTVLALRRMLKPSEMDSSLETLRQQYHPGTRTWLFDTIQKWASSTTTEERLFWLKAPPGTGKSIVAAHLAESLRETHHVVATFLCNHSEASRSDPGCLTNTIALQLAAQIPAVHDHLRKCLDDDPEIVNSELPNRFRSLITEPLQDARSLPDDRIPTIILIDALDECGTIGSTHRASFLDTLFYNISLFPPFVKVFLTCRPDEQVNNAMKKHLRPFNSNSLVKIIELALDDERNWDDLQLYAQSRLQQMEHMEHLGPDKVADAARQLATAAGGIFMWLYFICEEIADCDSPATILRDLELGGGGSLSGTERMDAMYLRAFECGYQGRPPASIDSGFLGLDIATVRATFNRSQCVLQVVGGRIQVIHKSFADFVTDPARCTDERFFIDRRNMAGKVAVMALKWVMSLKRDACEIQDASLFNSEILDLSSRIAEHLLDHLIYSCKFWVHHLEEGAMSIELAELCEKFSTQKLLEWLEVLSLMQLLSAVALPSLRRFERYCQQAASTASSAMMEKGKPYSADFDVMAELAADAQRFLKSFWVPISSSALHIYLSALPFCPTETKLYQYYTRRYSDIPHMALDRNTTWSACMAVVEDVRADLISLSSNRIFSLTHDVAVVMVRDLQSGAKLGEFGLGKEQAVSLVVSPDGSLIAVGLDNGAVQILDAATNSCQHTLMGHTAPVVLCIFTADEKRIITTSEDQTVCVWRVATGEREKTMAAPENRVLTFSADGERMVWGGLDNLVRVCTFVHPDEVKVLGHHDGDITHVMMTPDGTRVVSCSRSILQVWDIQSSVCVVTIHHTPYFFRDVSTTPDSTRLVTASNSGAMDVWTLSTGKKSKWFQIDGNSVPNVDRVAVSPCGTRVVSIVSNRTMQIWDLDGQSSHAGVYGRSGRIKCMAVSHDHAQIATGSTDMRVRTWDALTGQGILVLKGHTGSVNAVTYTMDGKKVISAGVDKTVRVWAADTGATVWILTGHPVPIVSLVVDSNDVFAMGFKGRHTCWNITTGGADELGLMVPPEGWAERAVTHEINGDV
ncbi:hypothetical protein HK104_010416 [Borealophlyctis nickersoniae]|nr:hypothetical protein HK104_010416 [Borealophlyctis nickersoniae]